MGKAGILPAVLSDFAKSIEPIRFGPSTTRVRSVKSRHDRMSLSTKLSLLLAACLLLGLGIFVAKKPAGAQLKWESKTLEFQPALTEKVITAGFKFTNVGKHPVTIESVKSGCGCTTAIPVRKDFQPGEKGRITATFTIGERTGLQNIPIIVKLLGENERVKLSLIAHIPDLMTVTPQLLYWQVGDAPEPKAVALHVEPGVQLRITNVTSIDPTFKTTLETIEEGREYRLLVQPETTGGTLMAAITIDALISGEIQKSFTVFPNIKPAEKK